VRCFSIVVVACLLLFSLQVFADFTIGVIPDTQNMAEDDIEAQKIMKMLKYFVDKKEELNVPHSFKKSRCDEEQGAVCKQARERSILRNQAGCELERSSSRMLILAFDRAIL